jgi:hypothetical protein
MKKRQVTMAKMAREREVRERRARKLEKKHAAAAERRANSEGATSAVPSPPDSGVSPEADSPV